MYIFKQGNVFTFHISILFYVSFCIMIGDIELQKVERKLEMLNSVILFPQSSRTHKTVHYEKSICDNNESDLVINCWKKNNDRILGQAQLYCTALLRYANQFWRGVRVGRRKSYSIISAQGTLKY